MLLSVAFAAAPPRVRGRLGDASELRNRQASKPINNYYHSLRAVEKEGRDTARTLAPSVRGSVRPLTLPLPAPMNFSNVPAQASRFVRKLGKPNSFLMVAMIDVPSYSLVLVGPSAFPITVPAPTNQQSAR